MTCRLLVLEDDTNLRNIYASHLEGEGNTVVACANAEEALAKFKPGEFDAMLVDYRLPKMSGLDFVRRVRAKDEKVGVVIATAANLEEVDQKCEGLGVWAVIPKPSTLSRITEKIHEACELSHLSPEKEAEFVKGLEKETRGLKSLRVDLLNETGIWPPDQLSAI
jgi:CheY-like chemotaxis protein